LLAVAGSAHAQRGRGAGAGQAQTPQAAAPIDLTGYWVSIVNEDWRWRMVTPPKGDYASIANLMTAEARKIADAWDPSQDGSCLAYGAAGLMRIPTRLHVTWENENTLKIDTDAGQQTRRLVFGASAEAPATRSLQGFSVAEWELAGARRGGGPGGRFGPPGAGPALPGGAPPTGAQAAGAREGAPAGPAAGGQAGRGRATGAPPVGGPAGGPPGAAPGGRGGNLKVVTTQMSGGWLRKNGVPYSESATMTEYYDRFPVAPKDEWLVVTTIVADPKYLTQEFVTSTHFRHEPDGAKWDPTPCKPGP
jgi:hypothetical protein